MVTSQPKPHLFLLCFITLTPLIQSTPSLLHSDLKALLLIHKDLGFRSSPPKNPCGSAGIFCERRSTPNYSHALRITTLVFESRQLSGRLSPAISKLTELKQLSLPNNHLFDQIPPQIVECEKLEILNLKNNRFSGQVPPGLSWLVRLRVLDFAGNKFSGNLKFLKHFPNLEELDLADNMLAGTLPASLRSFRNLRFLNISGNSLLEGPLPFINNHIDHHKSEEIQTIIPIRYVLAENFGGNDAISTPAPAPNQDNTAGRAPAEAPAFHRKRNKKRRLIGWSLGYIAGAVGGIISGLVFSMVFKVLLILIHGRSKDSSVKIFSKLIKKPEDLAFLEKEDGLSTLPVIGKGGCGEVYKGSLPGSNGKEIAIKKIVQPPRDAEELTEEDSSSTRKCAKSGRK